MDYNPDSSVLDALLDLAPPSPMLSPSLPASWNSGGDISILLEGIVLDSGILENDRYSLASTTSLVSSDTRSSLGSIGTVGTFGPPRTGSALIDIPSPTLSLFPPIEEFKPGVDILGPEIPHCSSQYTLADSTSPTLTTLSFPLDDIPSPTSPTPSASVWRGRTARDTSLCPSPSTHTLRHSESRQSLLTPTSSFFHLGSLSLSPSRSKSRSPRSSILSVSSSQSGPETPQHERHPQYSCHPVSPRLQTGIALKDTIVELLIDQEGFRSVCPNFKFVGFSTKKDPGGIVSFMPIERYTYNFHYAPFESVPILRRVTVNGTESKDYISRQANLPIKNKGVYTVTGTEELNPKIGTDLPKLQWRFDYVVDDRRYGTPAGRKPAVEGEKTLTPLTFSCSPSLLDPRQGKKVKLMHVFRKTMVTKLVAERQNPPIFANAASVLKQSSQPPPQLFNSSSSISSLAAIVQASTVHYVKSHVWSLHRRAHSHIVAVDVAPLPASLDLPGEGEKDCPLTSRTMASPKASRRRRASSAGERSRHPVLGEGFTLPRNVNKATNISRHIIPPDELSELMANIENTPPVRHRKHPATIALSPPPRQRLKPF